MPRKTPIERAIDGEPMDRRRRYEMRMSAAGLTTVRVLVPHDRADDIRRYAQQLRDEARRDD